MDNRIGIFEVEILMVESDPPMDCASVGGELILDQTKWEFKSNCEELTPHGLYRVIGEKDTDVRGGYIRIHEILASLEVNV